MYNIKIKAIYSNNLTYATRKYRLISYKDMLLNCFAPLCLFRKQFTYGNNT